MSGPPYPRPNPVPGSNAIGSFEIGVSPIGNIPAFDFWTTVISQYANSPTLMAICNNMAQYLDPTLNFSEFFDFIWNINTAQGTGLDIWGRIIGVSRVVQIPVSNRYFGTEEQLGSTDPFNVSPFFIGAPTTNNFALTDANYRTLLFAKALANICDGSIPAINQLLMNLFPNLGGNAYVIDGNLEMTYRFDFVLTPVQLAIVQNSGVLPRPPGVSVLVSTP